MALAEAIEAVLATRDQLVDVRLMAGVPDDDVTWRLEDTVDCNGELHRAKVRAQVASGA